MKNPLRKRYTRELKSEFSKYLVIFILLVVTIGFVSGFEVADQSISVAYNNGMIVNNVEDGHFTSERKLSISQKRIIEKSNVRIYDLNYYEESFTNGTEIRIFAKRKAILANW